MIRKQVFPVSFPILWASYRWYASVTLSSAAAEMRRGEMLHGIAQAEDEAFISLASWESMCWPDPSALGAWGFSFFSALIINSSQPCIARFFHVHAEPLGRSWKCLYFDLLQLTLPLCHPHLFRREFSAFIFNIHYCFLGIADMRVDGSLLWSNTRNTLCIYHGNWYVYRFLTNP